MGQINIKPGNFKPTATGTYGYSFDSVGRPVRVNADGSTTPLAEASDQTPVITANLGVGLLADRPAGAIGDVYVASDTIEVHTKVDAVTWNVSELVEGSFVTDEIETRLYQVYADSLNQIASISHTDTINQNGDPNFQHITNTQKDKLDGIEEGAEVNQTDSEIKTQYENNANTNAFTDSEKAKLNTIEEGAEVNVNSDWNATTGDSQILNKPSDITDLSLHTSSDLSDGSDLVKNTRTSTDNALTRFDGTTGKVIQNSIGKIDDDGNLSEIKDTSTETVTIDSAVQMSYDSVNQSLKFNFL